MLGDGTVQRWDCGSGLRVINYGWALSMSKYLGSMSMGITASTVVRGYCVYAMVIDDNKVIIEGLYWKNAYRAILMAKLDSKA